MPLSVPLNSAVLRAVTYQPSVGELDIQYSSGRICRFFDIPMALYRELLEAQNPLAVIMDKIDRQFCSVIVTSDQRRASTEHATTSPNVVTDTARTRQWLSAFHDPRW